MIESSVINSDSDSSGKSRSQTSLLNFLQSEASSVSQLGIVLSGWGVYHWSKLLKGSWESACCLFLSSNGPSLFASWLIEPCLEEILSVFSQMNIGENVVVLDHLGN
jgi:hypothetical protein